MIQNKVLDYLQEHGENIASDIQIENITTRSIQAGLSKLFSLNKVARRQVVKHSARPVWAS